MNVSVELLVSWNGNRRGKCLDMPRPIARILERNKVLRILDTTHKQSPPPEQPAEVAAAVEATPEQPAEVKGGRHGRKHSRH